MTDLTVLKENYHLLDVVPDLKKVGANVYAGPCPFCGGTDRFQIKQARGGDLWICRKCSDGKYHDAVDFLARREGLDLRASNSRQRYEAMQRIAGIMGGALDEARSVSRPEAIPEARQAPDWQASAMYIMQHCRETLWNDTGIPARRYLLGDDRLLTNSMLQTWDVGYSVGFEHGGVWVPRGIVIPCFEFGQVWYLKIRLLPGEKFKCAKCKTKQTTPGKCACGMVNKYRGVTGNVPGLFGAGTMAGSTVALVCEGEFDAMHLWAAVGRLDAPYINRVAVITTGASSHHIDPVTWGRYGLLNIKKFVTIFDNDEAGRKAHEHLQAITRCAVRGYISQSIGGQPVKDITDFVRAGGDLTAWIKFQIEMI